MELSYISYAYIYDNIPRLQLDSNSRRRIINSVKLFNGSDLHGREYKVTIYEFDNCNHTSTSVTVTCMKTIEIQRISN